jgi:hypothetical protein
MLMNFRRALAEKTSTLALEDHFDVMTRRLSIDAAGVRVLEAW